MEVIVPVLLVFVGSTMGLEERDAQGILRMNSGAGLTPGGTAWNFHSPNYPEGSPPNLLQTWTMETHPEARIRIHCIEIRIPYQMPGVCHPDYLLTIEDGDETREYCDAQYDVKFLSKTNRLKFTQRTGSAGLSRINCTGQGREMGPYGEVTEAPTTPKAPRPPSYQFFESNEEIDSSEHGVAPGKKGTNCKCGWANKQNSRVVAGREALVNELPHMVGLIPRDNPYFIFCGGSIISPYHVLTAAHCTRPYAATPIAVKIGEHNVHDDSESNITQIVNVVKVVEHEKYNNRLPLKFDLALAVLERRVDYTQLIGPICLPRGKLNLDYENVKIAGWGRIHEGGPPSPVLKVVDVKVVPEEECFGEKIPDASRICTFGKRKGSCVGDSGGPVMWVDPDTNRYTIVGLVSYAGVCGGSSPRVSADVSNFIEWIYKNIRETQPYGYICSKLN